MGDINDTLLRKRQQLFFCTPLTLATDRQLKNCTVIIPTYHDLDGVLLVKFFKIPGHWVSLRQTTSTSPNNFNWWWQQDVFTCQYDSKSRAISHKDCTRNWTSKVMCGEQCNTTNIIHTDCIIITQRWHRSQSSILWMVWFTINPTRRYHG